MKRKYAIVDIETTGGLARRDKITEIGIVISDGNKVIDTYESLVNPERSIPYNITRITGITNDMVEAAPKFYEIAKQVIELLEGCIFIAHNVRFDYSFIKEEFKQLGFTFTKKQLCTVVLSRKAFPNLKSYSLGNLIKYFNINVNARHRALEDAIATTDIFHKILAQFETQDATKIIVNDSIHQTRLPKNITKEQINDLPQTCGVYYFMDDDQRIVYVGKSINIQKRVISHFGKLTSKSSKMMTRVSNIDFAETGSELVALLKEAIDIKKYKPEINKLQKKSRLPFAIYTERDKMGFIIFKTGRIDSKKMEGKKVLQSFEKLYHAKLKVKNLTESFELCLKINELEKTGGPCFNYTIGKCTGVCIGSELPQIYNLRALEAQDVLFEDFEDNFVVIDRGRSGDEKSVVLVEEGKFKGYGYATKDDQYMGIEELKEAISYAKIIPGEANSIIRQYIWKKSNQLEIMYF